MANTTRQGRGVWLDTSRPDPTASLPERIVAAGEEKTIATMPAGYGYGYDGDWVLNSMLHNLTSASEELWITYDLDILPGDAPEAEDMATARPIWMDLQNGSAYPVFDVLKGSGQGGSYTYPAQAPPDDDGPRRPSGPATATACSSSMPATTPAAPRSTRTCAAATARCNSSTPGPRTTTPTAPCRGTWP